MPLKRLAFCLLLAPGAAGAEELDTLPLRTTLTVERHATSNALDEPLALPDWYTAMRGTLEGDLEHALGTTNLTLDGEFTRYDAFAIENDHNYGAAVATTLRPTENLEAKARLFARASQEGDTLVVGDLAIGMTTRKQVFGGALDLGLRTGPATVLVARIAASREDASLTRFEDDVLPAVQFEPDRDRASVSLGATRSFGQHSYGLRGTAERIVYRGIFADAIDLDRFELRGEWAYAPDESRALALSVGGEWLHAEGGLVDVLRPALRARFATPTPLGIDIEASALVAMDTEDTDDLLASWTQQGQLRLSAPLARDVVLASGVYLRRRDNLLLDYRDETAGVFGELAWQAADRTAIVLRVDYRRETADALDFSKEAIDAAILLKQKI